MFATPPLGWNHWNAFHCDVSERLIVAMADAMVESGMAAAGFKYLVRYLRNSLTRPSWHFSLVQYYFAFAYYCTSL